MTLLSILKVPDPRLRLKAHVVEKVDDTIKDLMKDMLETMHAEDGVGLAAIQVGIQKRVIAVDWGREIHPHPLLMANPEIVWKSDKLEDFEEGCLSVPGQYGTVKRAS